MYHPSGRARVLHVGKYYPPYMGGMETHLKWLAERQAEIYDVSVIVANTSTRTVREEINGVSVCRTGSLASVARSPLCPMMAREIAVTCADIVHIHLPNPMGVLAYSMSGHIGKLILTEHGEVIGRKVLKGMFQPILEVALKRAEFVIATSREYIRHSSVLSMCEQKSRVVPLGIPLHMYETVNEERVLSLKKKYGDQIVVSVGRLVPFKGMDYLIKAMQGLKGSLLVLGKGPEMTALASLARELGVEGQVHFLGAIRNEEVPEYLHAAKVFVLASVDKRESFGIVQLEAMACGLPVINTRLESGVPSVSVHGRTGLTVQPADAAQLREAIGFLLENPSIAAAFGARGRRRVHEEFEVGLMARRTIGLYEELLHTAGMIRT